MSIRATIVFGAALALMSGGALAASKESSTAGTVSVGVPAVAAETAPQAAVLAEKAVDPAKPEAVQIAQRPGMAKPIRVYWFLSGR